MWDNALRRHATHSEVSYGAMHCCELMQVSASQVIVSYDSFVSLSPIQSNPNASAVINAPSALVVSSRDSQIESFSESYIIWPRKKKSKSLNWLVIFRLVFVRA